MSLPLPNVVANVGPGGPLTTSLRGTNALMSDFLGNKMKGVQADYAPYTTYANAASKLAYANMLPFQIKATLMSNPMLWQSLQNNPQAMNALMKNFAGSIPQGNDLFGGVNIPKPGQNQTSNSLLGMLMDKLKGGSSQENAMGAPDQGMGADQGMQMPPNALAQGFGGSSMRPPSALPGLQQNPYLEMKQGTAEAGAQGVANVDAWKKLNEATGTAAIESQNSLNDLNRFREAYKNLGKAEKGPLLGRLPSVTSEADIADQAANSMRASLLRQLQQGHITNKDFDIGMSLKPSRALNPKAEEAISNFMEGTGLRAQERLDFNVAATNMGLTVPQANLLWTKYIHDKPFYDEKSKGLIRKNLEGWPEYLNPEKAGPILNKSLSSGGMNLPPAEAGMPQALGRSTLSDEDIALLERNKIAKKKESLGGKNESNENFIMMKTPDGKQWHVPPDKVNDALKLGALPMSE